MVKYDVLYELEKRVRYRLRPRGPVSLGVPVIVKHEKGHVLGVAAENRKPGHTRFVITARKPVDADPVTLWRSASVLSQKDILGEAHAVTMWPYKKRGQTFSSTLNDLTAEMAAGNDDPTNPGRVHRLTQALGYQPTEVGRLVSAIRGWREQWPSGALTYCMLLWPSDKVAQAEFALRVQVAYREQRIHNADGQLLTSRLGSILHVNK